MGVIALANGGSGQVERMNPMADGAHRSAAPSRSAGPAPYWPGKSLMMVIMAGPKITMNRLGKMQKTKGKSILMGAL